MVELEEVAEAGGGSFSRKRDDLAALQGECLWMVTESFTVRPTRHPLCFRALAAASRA